MSILSLAQSALGVGIPVLCYHQVRPESGMTPQKFGGHLDLLRKMGFRTIGLSRLFKAVTGGTALLGPAMVITFDDCTLDNWVYAVPELIQRDMVGVFFAITDFLRPGQARPRADQAAPLEPIPAFPDIMRNALHGHVQGFMNQAEIQSLVHDLGMEVYSHSAAHQACFINSEHAGFLADNSHWSHRFLCGPDSPPETPVHPVGSAYAHAGFGLDRHGRPLELNPEPARLAFCLEDFSASRIFLESVLNRPCPFLCLPWGQYDGVTLKAAAQAGYSGVLNLDRTPVGPGTDPMRTGRLAVRDRKSRPWLALKTLALSLKTLAPLAGGGKQP